MSGRARLRRIALTAGAVLMFLVLAGATYQGVATALERRRVPHPGRLIDVGGHQLHLHCDGDGAPTVVLEAPAAGMSAAWGWVQLQIADLTRVCSYDRAGLGWSEAGTARYQPDAVAGQLLTLLQRGGEPGPYVVAGQGLGAALATLFAARVGPDAAALVLIDARPVPAAEGPTDRGTRMAPFWPWLARAGVLRAAGTLADRASGLPEPAAGALRAFLNRPDHLTRTARELARWDDTIRLADAAALGPDVRVARVEAAGPARVAFLATRADADKATRAIADAVRAVRSPAARRLQPRP
ncbi:MAG: alpha/beta hydrolase [Acidobacteria bacterium]|nr:alpha/beta hydrolase [Acidobacteriota bacterium]